MQRTSTVGNVHVVPNYNKTGTYKIYNFKHVVLASIPDKKKKGNGNNLFITK